MTKGSYRHLIYACLALGPAIYLTFWGPASSWSANVWLGTMWMLNTTLLFIAEAQNEIIYEHPQRDKEIYKWFGRPVRLRHLARYTKHSFHGILLFYLGNLIPPAWVDVTISGGGIFPDWVHMAATASGILGVALMGSGWYPTWFRPWWIFNGSLLVGVLVLVAAFAFDFGEVGYGELILAFVGFGFQRTLKWNNKKSDRYGTINTVLND